MLIPSIDLMDGKIVQLVQGEKKKLEFDNFDHWIERFSKYPVVQLIDLDAARGTGDNRSLVKQIVGPLNCQVGGAIPNPTTAHNLPTLLSPKALTPPPLLSHAPTTPP